MADTNVRKLPCAAMRLQYSPEDEAFRSELVAWLEANQPSDAVFREPKQSSAHMPQWAREWQRKLFDAGVFAPAVGYPTVAEGKARVRAIVSAGHKREQLLKAADTLAEVGKPLGVV